VIKSVVREMINLRRRAKLREMVKVQLLLTPVLVEG
jgi:hypothetical protein